METTMSFTKRDGGTYGDMSEDMVSITLYFTGIQKMEQKLT